MDWVELFCLVFDFLVIHFEVLAICLNLYYGKVSVLGAEHALELGLVPVLELGQELPLGLGPVPVPELGPALVPELALEPALQLVFATVLRLNDLVLSTVFSKFLV